MRASETIQQRFCSNIVLFTALLGFVLTAGAEPSGPEPIRVPDIRANIMKMLQQSPGMEGSDEEDLFAEAERQRKEKEQPPAARVEEKEEVAKPVATPVEKPVQQVEKPAKKAGKPVELPVKEIVIEDMDDLKKLAEELRKAKKRQAGQ